jgi:hypothetical protein
MALYDADTLQEAWIHQNHRIEQTLGKALGFPPYGPEVVENYQEGVDYGVCVGEAESESLALMAAKWIKHLEDIVYARTGSKPSYHNHYMAWEQPSGIRNPSNYY